MVGNQEKAPPSFSISKKKHPLTICGTQFPIRKPLLKPVAEVPHGVVEPSLAAHVPRVVVLRQGLPERDHGAHAAEVHRRLREAAKLRSCDPGGGKLLLLSFQVRATEVPARFPLVSKPTNTKPNASKPYKHSTRRAGSSQNASQINP